MESAASPIPGSPLSPSTGHQAPAFWGISGGQRLSTRAHTTWHPPAAPRWEPEPLGYQELKSERTELPASRLLEETALGRPRAEDSGTATGAGLGGSGGGEVTG